MAFLLHPFIFTPRILGVNYKDQVFFPILNIIDSCPKRIHVVMYSVMQFVLIAIAGTGLTRFSIYIYVHCVLWETTDRGENACVRQGSFSDFFAFASFKCFFFKCLEAIPRGYNMH